MSKLYDKYKLLKEDNKELIYLFECGVFYISLDDDALVLSNKLNLKRTKFNKDIDKCGFPKSQIDKYEKIIKDYNIPYKLIKLEKNNQKCNNKDSSNNILNHYLQYLTTLNIDNITESEAKYILKYIQGLMINE